MVGYLSRFGVHGTQSGDSELTHLYVVKIANYEHSDLPDQYTQSTISSAHATLTESWQTWRWKKLDLRS
jgi:hypothetical protein